MSDMYLLLRPGSLPETEDTMYKANFTTDPIVISNALKSYPHARVFKLNKLQEVSGIQLNIKESIKGDSDA